MEVIPRIRSGGLYYGTYMISIHCVSNILKFGNILGPSKHAIVILYNINFENYKKSRILCSGFFFLIKPIYIKLINPLLVEYLYYEILIM